jgi:multiple sugar transport system ATP-binding protein
LALIEIENLTKRFGEVVAVDHLDLQIEAGEFLTLLGPSGCGKTTVLRMIAGLEIPDDGEIRIGGTKVFASGEGIFIPPAKRGVGLVFQSYALWPHMSVFENVAFGLQIQRLDKRDLGNQVRSTLNYMRLEGLGERYPEQLSGGQQQRVALARMLVTQPSIFLMDEPLSNLDAKLRMEMRTEIKRLHRESKATTVYVTHDQNEALTMSTKVAVMNKGRLQQVASPQEIYKRPSNLFVADFIGSPTINFIPGKIVKKPDGIFFQGGPLVIPTPSLKDCIERRVVAAIRPEDIRICKEAQGESVSGEIYTILPAGAEVILQVKRGDLTLSIREMGETSLDLGDQVHLLFSLESILLYDQENGTLLHPSE